MARHRLSRQGRTRRRLLGGRRRPDDLFERSFRSCTRCGEHVYVLAEDCRGCGQRVDLYAG